MDILKKIAERNKEKKEKSILEQLIPEEKKEEKKPEQLGITPLGTTRSTEDKPASDSKMDTTQKGFQEISFEGEKPEIVSQGSSMSGMRELSIDELAKQKPTKDLPELSSSSSGFRELNLDSETTDPKIEHIRLIVNLLREGRYSQAIDAIADMKKKFPS